MGKVTGFLEWDRELPPRRDPTERRGDFREIALPAPPGLLTHQAGRCMDCGVPFCQRGCPLGNRIPDWNDLVYHGRWRQAFDQLSATNNFPEFTGRLCPAPCEGACVLAIDGDAVTIEEVEKAIAERAFAEGWVQPRAAAAESGRRVAIVGSGPAGLAAAAQLSASGHRAIVYEADAKPGGLLRYGIPDFKLDKQIIDRRLAVLEAQGVEFITGTRVGTDVGWSTLHAEHDAVLVAIGAGRPRDLQVPGRDLQGIHLAMDYLTGQNRVIGGERPGRPPIDAAGRHVVILGGGDTGSDCLGTALRQGARRVTQVELLPAPPPDRREDNPWPEWPVIFRTSSSQREGGERKFALKTVALEGAGDAIEELVAVHVKTETRAGGQLALIDQPGEVRLPVELLILAMGFVGPLANGLVEDLGVITTGRGNIAVGERFATNVPGLFCAGDAQRGASLIVWAIADGRRAAAAIDDYLRTAG